MPRPCLHIAWPILAIFITACARDSKPVANVPIQPSAASQYQYAERERGAYNLGLIDADKDPKRFHRTRELIRQQYQKVQEYFPADRVFTPLARLTVIEMEAGLDDPRAKADRDDLEHAMRQLQALAEDYPEHEFIQAKSLYQQGQIQLRLQNYARAQEYFLEVRDTWKESQNEVIRELAQRAAFLYNRTYVNQ